MSGALSAVLGTGAAGGWMERFLRPASLRGRGFWIVSAEDDTARRWVTHEFPGRDEPWHEDLGLKPGSFDVAGLLIGDDVNRQVDALRAAAGKAGPARLVHPWYGTMQVVVLGCQVSRDANEGRVARFRLRLERFGERPAPSTAANFFTRVLDAIDEFAGMVAEAVAEFQALIALPMAAVSTVIGIAGGLAGIFQRSITGAGLLGVLGGTSVGQAIAALGAPSEADAASPAATTARIGAVATAIAALPAPAEAPNAPLRALLAVALDPSLVVVPTDRSTPAAASIADTAAALAATARALVAGEAARAALSGTWASREDALRDRDSLADALDMAAEAAAGLGWDDAWRAALATRALVVAEITARAAPLPRIRRLSLAVPLPASLVAYSMDPDALATVFARGTQIAERNRAPHPGFLPASRAVEVLQ
jgi:prophage DNA circulation protein